MLLIGIRQNSLKFKLFPCAKDCLYYSFSEINILKMIGYLQNVKGIFLDFRINSCSFNFWFCCLGVYPWTIFKSLWVSISLSLKSLMSAMWGLTWRLNEMICVKAPVDCMGRNIKRKRQRVSEPGGLQWPPMCSHRPLYIDQFWNLPTVLGLWLMSLCQQTMNFLNENTIF